MTIKDKEFGKFYDEHFEKIYKFVYFRVGANRERAEDLTQDVFLKAYDAFDRYDPSISKSAWIYTIARNHIINDVAKQKPQTDIEDVENAWFFREEWGERMELRYDEGRLMDAIQALPKDDADLIRMKYLEGWKFDEISKIMDVASGSLRVRATRILKRLRRVLKQK